MVVRSDVTPVNVRVYTDSQHKESKQSLLSRAIAIVTLTIYVGWLHILFALMVASIFYALPRYILLAIFSTLALPAKPVLWQAFNQHAVFRTWREYFKFSYLFEELMDDEKRYVFVEFPHGAWQMVGCAALLPEGRVNVMGRFRMHADDDRSQTEM